MGVKLPTVRNFLYCLSLETGGTVLGWLSAIFASIGLVLFSFLAIATVIALTSNEVNTDDVPAAVWILACIVYVIYILYLAIVLYAAVQLIRGTKNRNHVQMKLYLTLMVIGCVLSLLQIFTAGLAGIGSAILTAIIQAYFFICIYSLYQSVKEGGNATMY